MNNFFLINKNEKHRCFLFGVLCFDGLIFNSSILLLFSEASGLIFLFYLRNNTCSLNFLRLHFRIDFAESWSFQVIFHLIFKVTSIARTSFFSYQPRITRNNYVNVKFQTSRLTSRYRFSNEREMTWNKRHLAANRVIQEIFESLIPATEWNEWYSQSTKK